MLIDLLGRYECVERFLFYVLYIASSFARHRHRSIPIAATAYRIPSVGLSTLLASHQSLRQSKHILAYSP